MGYQKDLQTVAQLIKSKQNVKLIFMVGAGISTSAGIPDFRSPETGLYHNLQKLNLPYAEAVFDIDFFKRNPNPFYVLAQELYPGQFLPTKFHFLMKLFQDRKLLHRVYTQNIDTLERIAGVDDEYVVEAHGSFAANHCIECGEEYSNEVFKKQIFDKQTPIRCTKCRGLVKPDIVFFGEGLPEKFFASWEEDCEQMEAAPENQFITITAGTSLTVYPFASLPSEVNSSQLRLLVNKEKVGDFKANARKSDLLFIESSDQFATDLVELLGWTEQFDRLIEETESKLFKPSVETVEEKVEEITETVKEELDREEKLLSKDVGKRARDELTKSDPTKPAGDDPTKSAGDEPTKPAGDEPEPVGELAEKLTATLHIEINGSTK